MKQTPARVRLVAAAGATALVGSVLTLTASAATPASGTVALPEAGGSNVVTYTGSAPANANGLGCMAPTDDEYALTITAPADLAKRATSSVTVAITNTAADGTTLDFNIYDSTGASVGSGSSDTVASATLTAPAPGTYTVDVCDDLPSTAGATTAYAATVTATSVALGGAAADTTHIQDEQDGFTSATVVDPLLFGGEPGIHFDPKTAGKTSYIDWPNGSTQVGLLYKSTDGGLSYTKRYADPLDTTSAGAACVGRQVPLCPAGGGGDTDVKINPDNGDLLYASQVALANEAAGVSHDGGDTFAATNVDTAVGKGTGGVDRQWLGTYKGTQTEFIGFHVPIAGYYLYRNDSGGAVGQWGDPAGAVPGQPLTTPQILGVTQSGGMIIDNGTGYWGDKASTHGAQPAIYVAYISSNLVPGSCDADNGFAVGVSTDGGKTFTCHTVPDGGNARSFTKVDVDSDGNLYAAWTDNATQKTYLSTAPLSFPENKAAPGSKWTPRVVINAGTTPVTIFPNIIAGTPGRIAISYYGTTQNAATPDTVPVGGAGWKPYLAFTTDALCQSDGSCGAAGPVFHISTVAHRINQDDNICTSGTTCAATMGNRNLADYFDVSMDANGYLGYVWADGANSTKEPFIKVTREFRGPSLIAGEPDLTGSDRVNGAADATGDAIYPFAGAQIHTAPNHPNLDLTGTTVGLKDSTTLEVRMDIADATKLGDVVPATMEGTTLIQQARYVTRFDTARASYYVEATVPRGGTPTFGAGQVDTAEAIQSSRVWGNNFMPQTAATGRVEGNTLIIDVAASTVGAEVVGTPIYSVGSYAVVGATDLPAGVQDERFAAMPLLVDSTPTFDTAFTATSITGGPVLTGPVYDAGGTVVNGASGAAPTGGGSLASTGLPIGLLVLGTGLLGAAAVVRRRRLS